MPIDKVLSVSIANAAVNASAISNTANLVIGALNTGNTVVTGAFTANTSRSTAVGNFRNGNSTLSILTSNTGLGGSFFGIGGNINLFGISRYGNTTNTAVRLATNYTIDDSNGTTEFVTTGSKKAALIELNADDGSVSLYGESGSGIDYRAPTLNQGLKVTSAGYVLKPSMPSFCAYLTGSNPSYSTGNIVPYNATFWNTSGGFNTSTYRFTAPVAGKYFFHTVFNVYDIAVGNWFRIQFRVNGTGQVIGTYIASGTAGDQNIESSIMLNLTASDYVDVYFYTNDTSFSLSAGSTWQRFEGFLIG